MLTSSFWVESWETFGCEAGNEASAALSREKAAVETALDVYSSYSTLAVCGSALALLAPSQGPSPAMEEEDEGRPSDAALKDDSSSMGASASNLLFGALRTTSSQLTSVHRNLLESGRWFTSSKLGIGSEILYYFALLLYADLERDKAWPEGVPQDAEVKPPYSVLMCRYCLRLAEKQDQLLSRFKKEKSDLSVRQREVDLQSIRNIVSHATTNVDGVLLEKTMSRHQKELEELHAHYSTEAQMLRTQVLEHLLEYSKTLAEEAVKEQPSGKGPDAEWVRVWNYGMYLFYGSRSIASRPWQTPTTGLPYELTIPSSGSLLSHVIPFFSVPTVSVSVPSRATLEMTTVRGPVSVINQPPLVLNISSTFDLPFCLGAPMDEGFPLSISKSELVAFRTRMLELQWRALCNESYEMLFLIGEESLANELLKSKASPELFPSPPSKLSSRSSLDHNTWYALEEVVDSRDADSGHPAARLYLQWTTCFWGAHIVVLHVPSIRYGVVVEPSASEEGEGREEKSAMQELNNAMSQVLQLAENWGATALSIGVLHRKQSNKPGSSVLRSSVECSRPEISASLATLRSSRLSRTQPAESTSASVQRALEDPQTMLIGGVIGSLRHCIEERREAQLLPAYGSKKFTAACTAPLNSVSHTPSHKHTPILYIHLFLPFRSSALKGVVSRSACAREGMTAAEALPTKRSQTSPLLRFLIGAPASEKNQRSSANAGRRGSSLVHDVGGALIPYLSEVLQGPVDIL